MKIILFEDYKVLDLEPITLNRPIFNIRYGIKYVSRNIITCPTYSKIYMLFGKEKNLLEF